MTGCLAVLGVIAARCHRIDLGSGISTPLPGMSTVSTSVTVSGWQCRRSSRTGAHRQAVAVPSRCGRRATRSGRFGLPLVATPSERRAVPAAIRRLLAPHGNRGVTPYRSVSLMVRTGRYDVTPHHYKRQIYLGSYETAEQAGRVADLAEVAAGKPGMRLNFEGEYGAEMERVAEVAAQPGMTPDKLKVRLANTTILSGELLEATGVDGCCRRGWSRHTNTSKL